MSLLEAMALGKPAVCTAVGDVPEVLLEGETGLLIPPGDPGALAEALARILSEPELAGRMAAGARSRFEGGYGVRNMVGAYENLFRELLCQKKASR